MPRILPVSEISPALQVAFERHTNEYNASITNMKGTLAHSLPAFEIYMQWYPLYEEVKKVAGKRSAYLYAWSISSAADCPLCSAFFRRIMIDAGEKPEQLELNEYETKLVAFGGAIGKHKGYIADYVYNNLAQYHNNEEMVILIAFAGQMIATNIFNNVIETEIDSYLAPYIPVKYPS